MSTAKPSKGRSGSIPGLAPRLLAVEKLQSVLGGQSFTPAGAAEMADARDRALANRLVTVALRRQGHLNEIIRQLLSRGLPKKSGSFEPVLRIGLSELLFMPGQTEHAALFLAVEALKTDAKARHLSKLLNGVLRNAQRRHAELANLEPALLVPEWLRMRWTQCYGADCVMAFCEALLAGAPLDLTLRYEDPALVTDLGAVPLIGDSVRVPERDRRVQDLSGYAEGRFWVQDVSSAIPARLFGLSEGARVLDMCAAPGGKTLQLTKAGYAVTALDNDAARLARVGENLERTGLAAGLVTADAGTFEDEAGFDGVLLDAPCSATGTFRRHPEVIWHRSEKDLAGRVKLQRKLLRNAAALLKPGGVLIYCTCSLEPEEGEGQAAWVTQNIAGLQPLPVTGAELSGLAGAVTPEGHVRLHPGLGLPGDVAGGMDGFFAARFRKD